MSAPEADQSFRAVFSNHPDHLAILWSALSSIFLFEDDTHFFTIASDSSVVIVFSSTNENNLGADRSSCEIIGDMCGNPQHELAA
jgi:hypothetical protein